MDDDVIWRPSRRRPDCDDQVLVWDGSDHSYKTAHWDEHRRVWRDEDGGFLDSVYAWMEIPEVDI